MQPQKPAPPITDVQPPESPAPTKPVPAPQDASANTPETPQHIPMEQPAKVEKPHTSPRQHTTIPVIAIVITLLVTTALAAVAITMYFQQKGQTTTPTNTSNNY
jgi:hypothetical protein